MPKDPAGRQDVRPLRLFVAVEIPEEAKDEAWLAVVPWEERFPDARWVPRENWHVTLKFLGSTRPPLTEWVRERIADVARESAAFEARLVGLGAFPSPRRARVLWAGLEDGAAMTRLAGALEAAFAPEFKPEARPFRPHLTVARSEPPLGLPKEFGETVLEGGLFGVGALTLFRSHLRRPAPAYERLATFSLGG